MSIKLFVMYTGDPEWEDTEDSTTRTTSKTVSLTATSTALAVPQSLHVCILYTGWKRLRSF